MFKEIIQKMKSKISLNILPVLGWLNLLSLLMIILIMSLPDNQGTGSPYGFLIGFYILLASVCCFFCITYYRFIDKIQY